MPDARLPRITRAALANVRPRVVGFRMAVACLPGGRTTAFHAAALRTTIAASRCHAPVGLRILRTTRGRLPRRGPQVAVVRGVASSDPPATLPHRFCEDSPRS
jgi:hypothetical protein